MSDADVVDDPDVDEATARVDAVRDQIARYIDDLVPDGVAVVIIVYHPNAAHAATTRYNLAEADIGVLLSQVGDAAQKETLS